MKSTMKKLLCMALAIMLLVSAVPVFAAAAGGTYVVDVIITNTNKETLKEQSITENDGRNATAQEYLDFVYGGYASEYTVNKVWIKNAETTDNGLTVGLDHQITRDTRLVIKLEHKPVNLYLKIMKGETLVETVTKSVAYGSTVNLTDALAVEAGYSGFDARVTSGSLQEGQSFTATADREVTIYLVTDTTSGGSGTGSGSNNTTTPTSKSVTLEIKNVEGGKVVWTTTDNLSGDTTTVKNLLYYWYSKSWQDSYTFTKAYSSNQKAEVAYEGTIAAGDTVTVVLTPKSGSTVTPPSSTTTPHVSIILNNKTSNFDSYFNVTPVDGRISSTDVDTAYDRVQVPSGYRLVGWRRENVQECKELGRIDCRNLTVSINVLPVFEKVSTTTSDCGYTIDNLSKPGDVVLHVYLNNNFESEHKAYTINSIAKDGKLSLMDDVKDFLKQYYTAKTSDGIEYRGMYVANGYYGVQYISGNKTEVIGGTVLPCGHTELDHKRAEGRVDLNVMLMNAKAKSSSTADSSNPKTGDTIFVPVMVLGLTASALAAAYVIGKKRFAR